MKELVVRYNLEGWFIYIPYLSSYDDALLQRTERQENVLYYDADGKEIGQVVVAPGFEDFALIQLIWNDPCNGINGIDYKSPGPVGLGNR